MAPASGNAEIVREFKHAWENKDIQALIALLASDATSIADGGGRASAVRDPVEGAEQIARTFAEIAGRTPRLQVLECIVNGQPGLMAQQDGVTVTVLAFDFTGDRIRHIWVVRNPAKLQPWKTAQ